MLSALDQALAALAQLRADVLQNAGRPSAEEIAARLQMIEVQVQTAQAEAAAALAATQAELAAQKPASLQPPDSPYADGVTLSDPIADALVDTGHPPTGYTFDDRRRW